MSSRHNSATTGASVLGPLFHLVTGTGPRRPPPAEQLFHGEGLAAGQSMMLMPPLPPTEMQPPPPPYADPTPPAPPHAANDGGGAELPTEAQFAQMMSRLIDFSWERSLGGETAPRVVVAKLKYVLTPQDTAIKAALTRLSAEFLEDTTTKPGPNNNKADTASAPPRQPGIAATVLLQSSQRQRTTTGGVQPEPKKRLSELCVFLAGVLLKEEIARGKPLLRNVENHDAFAAIHQEATAVADSSGIRPNDRFGRRLEAMYPPLLNLMMGIQVHLDMHAEEVREELFLRHTVMLVWRNVLGMLHTLLLVVQNAHYRGYVVLKAEPRNWESLIKEKRERVHAAEHALHALATEEVQVNTALEPYRASLERLHQDFDGYRQALQLTAARKAQAMSFLNWEMDVGHMLAAHDPDMARRIAAQLLEADVPPASSGGSAAGGGGGMA